MIQEELDNFRMSIARSQVQRRLVNTIFGILIAVVPQEQAYSLSSSILFLTRDAKLTQETVMRFDICTAF
jgi:hypothetical protein